MIVPTEKVTSPEDLFPGWMLLSYNKPVEVSSSLNDFPATNAVNEDIRTWWSAKSGDKGEYLSVDLGEKSTVYAIQVNFADQDAAASGKNPSLYYQYQIESSENGKNWDVIVDKSASKRDACNQYIQLNRPVDARYVRITNLYYPSDKFSVSGFRVFGNMDKPLPQKTNFTDLQRLDENRRTVKLTWEKVKGATGYNIRFGSNKDKLYQTYQVYDDNQVAINILNVDQSYYFSIDSFNEAGLTKGTEVLEIK